MGGEFNMSGIGQFSRLPERHRGEDVLDGDAQVDDHGVDLVVTLVRGNEGMALVVDS